MVRNFIRLVLSRSVASWIEFATDINNVMYAYIDRKKKLPVTTLLRAIGLDSDKDIIEIFGLARCESKQNEPEEMHWPQACRPRVLKTWVEDFVDEYRRGGFD